MYAILRIGGAITVVLWSMILMTNSNGCSSDKRPSMGARADAGTPESTEVRELKCMEICGGKASHYEFRQHEGLALCWCFWTEGSRAGYNLVLFDYVRAVAVREIPHSGKYGGCVLSPDGSIMLSRSEPAYSLCLRDSTSGEEQLTFIGHQDEIRDIVWFPDGRYFVSIAKELPVFVWDVEAAINGSEQILKQYAGHRTHYPSAVAVSPDGKRVASADWGGYVYVWDPHSLETIREFPRFVDPEYVAPPKLERYTEEWRGTAIVAIAFTPDNRRLIAVTTLGHVVVLDVDSGKEITRYRQPGGVTSGDKTLMQHISHAVPLAVSPDGKRLLYTMQTQPVRLLDVETGILLAAFQGHTRQGRWDLDDSNKPGGVRNLAFSPDGKMAVTAGDDGTIRLWELPE